MRQLPEDFVPAVVRQRRKSTGRLEGFDSTPLAEHVNDMTAGKLGAAVDPLLLAEHLAKHVPILMKAREPHCRGKWSRQWRVPKWTIVVSKACNCYGSTARTQPVGQRLGTSQRIFFCVFFGECFRPLRRMPAISQPAPEFCRHNSQPRRHSHRAKDANGHQHADCEMKRKK